jgi:hypothetical protein
VLPERLVTCWPSGLGATSPTELCTGILARRSREGSVRPICGQVTISGCGPGTHPKTRVVAVALETRGFRTRIVERAYDENFRPVPHANPARNEPTIALAGFDDITPRRLLGEADFTRIVDAGLGAGPIEYPGIRQSRFYGA